MSNPKESAARRIQYAALPFRRNADSGVDVMLVTSRGSGRWVIPKGWPIRQKFRMLLLRANHLRKQASWEKAGRNSTGTYTYEKRLANGTPVISEVQVFPLEVKRQRKDWPEEEEREVRWLSPSEAATAVQETALSDIILSMRGFADQHNLCLAA